MPWTERITSTNLNLSTRKSATSNETKDINRGYPDSALSCGAGGRAGGGAAWVRDLAQKRQLAQGALAFTRRRHRKTATGNDRIGIRRSEDLRNHCSGRHIRHQIISLGY